MIYMIGGMGGGSDGDGDGAGDGVELRVKLGVEQDWIESDVRWYTHIYDVRCLSMFVRLADDWMMGMVWVFLHDGRWKMKNEK